VEIPAFAFPPLPFAGAFLFLFGGEREKSSLRSGHEKCERQGEILWTISNIQVVFGFPLIYELFPG